MVTDFRHKCRRRKLLEGSGAWSIDNILDFLSPLPGFLRHSENMINFRETVETGMGPRLTQKSGFKLLHCNVVFITFRVSCADSIVRTEDHRLNWRENHESNQSNVFQVHLFIACYYFPLIALLAFAVL